MNIRRVTAALLAISLLVVACKSSSPQETPTATRVVQKSDDMTPPPGVVLTPADVGDRPAAGATATAAPTAAKAQATAVPTSAPTQLPSGPAVGEEDIKAMGAAWAAVKSYRMTLTGTTPEGQKINMLQEVVKPDRERFEVTAGGMSLEMIRIGNDTYSKLAGQWTKMTSAPGEMLSFTIDPDEVMQNFIDSTNRGDAIMKGARADINGVPCQEWVINTARREGSGSMFVGISDNLPRQFKTADGSATMTFSDWNASITIEAPQM